MLFAFMLELRAKTVMKTVNPICLTKMIHKTEDYSGVTRDRVLRYCAAAQS